MNTHQLDEERIFHVARQLPTPEGQSEYLDQVCAGDQALRERVEELLKVHHENRSFLKSSDSQVDATIDLGSGSERPGDTIGRYRLMEQIGEGGMGSVFVAHQDRPIRRKVALKVIKPGMDTKAVVARFEAERQALAMMDHPNIAKVLDAGTTDKGRPYFVMELVKGEPITEYCDRNRLTVRDRLELFIKACQAIQHAHQKGIIHRDIKPSNVMITEIDGKPTPKVIDFGVAKALGANLTDRTVYTSYQALVGTPLYMSPEQARLSGVDVDTSSDVYSLGILLYELLTGTTPLSPEEIKQAAQDEILRRIRETAPPRPSNRISSLGETTSQISQCRSTQPDQLGRIVRGDLDWIVMKALEKDCNRRYRTADAFATDVGRHLANEPVEARPPSPIYRLSRFYRRNKTLVGVLAFATTILVFASIASTTGWIAAERRQKELKVAMNKTNQLLIERALWQSVSGEFAAARNTLMVAEQAGAKKEWIYTVLGSIEFHEGNIPGAVENLSSAKQLNPNNVSAQALLAFAHVFSGRWEEWSEVAEFLQDANPGNEQPVFDELFLGYAHFYISYEVAANKLHHVVSEHPSWLVPRYVLAAAKSHQARESGDVNLARMALHEVDRVNAFDEPSPYVLLIKLHVYDTILELSESLNEDEVQKATEDGDRVARQLAEFKEYAVGSLLRYLHFGLTADDAAEVAAQRDLLEHGHGFLLLGPLADMIADGKYSEVLKQKGKGPEVEIGQAIVHAFQGNPDQAMAIYGRLKETHRSWYVRSRMIEIPLLLGEFETAQNDARQWLTDSEGLPSEIRCEEDRLEIVARMHVPTVREDWVPFKKNAYECIAGLISIGKGERASAMRHFEAARGAFKIGGLERWPKIYLKYASQMDDSAWVDVGPASLDAKEAAK